MRTWFVAALLASSAAQAHPITVGAGVGITQSEVNANGDPDQALNLFGRIGVAQRLSLQAEVQRIDAGTYSPQTRTVTGLLVIDLGTGPLVPVLLAGIGYDSTDDSNGLGQSAVHAEAGLGAEYRTRDGFTFGADVRIGDRSVNSGPTVMPLCCVTTIDVPSYGLADGQYRSARVTLGVRF
jgi:hypothetical protein